MLTVDQNAIDAFKDVEDFWELALILDVDKLGFFDFFLKVLLSF